MKELLEFYKNWMIYLGVFSGFIALILNAYVSPWLTKKIVKKGPLQSIISVTLSLLVMAACFYYAENYIRRDLWKSFYPDFNYSGIWVGETTYEKAYNSSKDVKLPFTVKHKAIIKQDALSISISPTESHDYVNWGSLAIELRDRNTLGYAYWVRYSNHDLFPDDAIGYEELKAVEYNESTKCPIKLTGEFYHCYQGKTPIYSGIIKFYKKQ